MSLEFQRVTRPLYINQYSWRMSAQGDSLVLGLVGMLPLGHELGSVEELRGGVLLFMIPHLHTH